MAKPSSPLRLFRALTLLHLLAILSLLSLVFHLLCPRSALAAAASSHQHFEGFEADDDADDVEDLTDPSSLLPSHSPPPISLSSSPSPSPPPPASPSPAEPSPKPSSLPEWDEDEFEGFEPSSPSTPSDSPSSDTASSSQSSSPLDEEEKNGNINKKKAFPGSYPIEIACVSFLIAFTINYFTGKVENERIALAWAEKFATKDGIFVKNFSLLGTGDVSGGDAPLLLKEGNEVFKFYGSGRRFCQGMLATMEMRSRHDLISRIFDLVMRRQDTITFEVVMNDDAMDHVIFAMARRKLVRAMNKEEPDLRRYAAAAAPPSTRKWVAEELVVVTESKEVAGDILTDSVLDQVFGEKAFEKFGKGFISMHFSDQLSGSRKKVLSFKFILPDVNNMADMSRLVALVPYYIDLMGRYKLSSQARSKTEAARAKAAQEAYRELQNARQEVLQRRKAEKKKLMEEAEAKLSAEALRKKEEKERARQMKRTMPKVKMLRS